MTRRRIAIAIGCAACASAGACADILGIDDGIPRTEDAAAWDASVPDVTALPDADALDALDALDAPVETATSPLACGASTCNVFGQACCRTGSASQADAESFACVADDAGCAGLRVTCDDSTSCAALGHPGMECCAVVPDGGTAATSTACVAKGACGAGVVMCQPGDDEICDVDAGQSCLPSVATILGWTICKT